ncbi:hypothetical protein K388_07239 [Streptomyces sp. KhCrAH-43]|uniref:hypothetical protein n=1 Tax=unclassified Streptomyces TaxID=2593676 RepID=UPI00037DEC91|nr:MULTISPECIES: hypothetical protein [unclassified Streptomyces]MYS37591.1 hypothetical protein [Streptomyces sp. SID4920]MYX68444.1 hypothetical protein [Streptomyces sp. SID8373]RAJ46780.1 hypothetical protein K388_07239 [Streptomyces sp. KhCrAH-43]
MPVVRYPNRSPVFVADRETVLNQSLSPTSRLVYVLLLASVDSKDHSLDEILSLAGLDSLAALDPHLAELEGVGAIELKDHIDRGEILSVYESPIAPEQRVHECIPCEDCSACSCEYLKGTCRKCSHIRRVRSAAQADIARWQEQVAAGKTYAVGSTGARLHRWDCRSLNTVERGLDSLEASVEASRSGTRSFAHWPGLPQLFTAEELRRRRYRKRNCALCGPDPL